MTDTAKELRTLVEESTPRLRSITEKAASEKPFPDKWSLKEILGHLIDSASNNHQRFVRMQEVPDLGKFSYAQEHWVNCQKHQSRSWQSLVEFWAHYNLHLSHVIAHIDPASLEHSCDMGYAKPASLRFVVEDYLRHVRHHLGQIMSNSDPKARVQWVRRNPA